MLILTSNLNYLIAALIASEVVCLSNDGLKKICISTKDYIYWVFISGKRSVNLLDIQRLFEIVCRKTQVYD